MSLSTVIPGPSIESVLAYIHAWLHTFPACISAVTTAVCIDVTPERNGEPVISPQKEALGHAEAAGTGRLCIMDTHTHAHLAYS